ncbi:serine protease 33 isoform X2 [Cydia splendana]|uniref:serine protease 33 isoform X2 n=1 Tax=Cydia splendana TaxID=1100963 RepID=UPI00300D71EA
MLSEKWKVILILATSVVAGESSRALSLVRDPYRPIFIPKYKPKRSRVLFLDDHENYQSVGRGEIDLTLEKVNSKIKFDDASDYDFTSPGDKTELSGNERFYEPRIHPFQYPLYQGRFGRYAPNFNFEPTVPYAPFPPVVRNSFYNGWKARSPRVVFPYSDVNAIQTNSHAGPTFNDNVVFRDSLNDVGENELAPQDDNSGGDAFAERGCGIAVGKQTAQRRIVGGDDAGFGTFPWQAYIRIGSSRCGGSLISRRHVVTAGHCVARAQPRHVRVTLGDYVINSAAEPLPAYTFGVRGIKVHPLFKFTPQADRFDVAVLTLDRNVHYMPHIAPICLPERGSDFLGQYGWAAGWGALSPGSRLRPRTLQAVDVPVLDNRVCERWHRANGINVVIYPEMLCAGYRGGGKDSCQGDSGGPLMLERAGRWYLIGVVSAGYSCASRGQPGIYHRVAHTVDWISHATTLS